MMPVRYYVPAADDQSTRDAVFARIQEQGLLPAAMSAVDNPTLEYWRALTHPARAWLLCAQEGADVAHARSGTMPRASAPGGGPLLGAALLTPWRHRVWEFDFTVFRPHFGQATALARGALHWVWAHAPCDSLMGLCPAPNRHAWRLAEAAGFAVLGRVPGACFMARRQQYVDGVLVCARRFTPAPGQATVFPARGACTHSGNLPDAFSRISGKTPSP